MLSRKHYSILPLLLTACSINVGRSDPKPMVSVSGHTQTSIALKLGSTVEDAFVVKSSDIKDANVTDFHSTLKAGFTNGFSTSFAKANDGGGAADLTLVLERVELKYVSAAVTAMGKAVAVNAQIKFLAKLTDREGNELKSGTGAVTGPEPASSLGAVTEATRSAVEAMYEMIASELF